MTDVRSEIPALAFINAQIIQEAAHAGVLDEPTRRVESMYRLPGGSLRVMNPAYLLGLLYCLIVVPKEFWLQDKAHPVFAQIDQDWLLGLVSVQRKTSSFDENPCYRLLRHLRNAVAHVHFTIDEGEFTFWDHGPRTDRETFRATFSLTGLGEFLSKVGALLANLRTEQLRPH